jgi:hypothetical protein
MRCAPAVIPRDMLDFDFVRSHGTEFIEKTGIAYLLLHHFLFFKIFTAFLSTRFSAQPVLDTFNPPMMKPFVFDLAPPGNIEIDGMTVSVDEKQEIIAFFRIKFSYRTCFSRHFLTFRDCIRVDTFANNSFDHYLIFE